jgi:hypothetical protein
MRMFILVLVLIWFLISAVLGITRRQNPDQVWNLTMRNGYWWREREGKDDLIESLGRLERIGPYKRGVVSIQMTSGEYSVRYDGRTGEINALFSASNEEISRRYTTAPDLPVRLFLHFIGATLGIMFVYWLKVRPGPRSLTPIITSSKGYYGEHYR